MTRLLIRQINSCYIYFWSHMQSEHPSARGTILISPRSLRGSRGAVLLGGLIVSPAHIMSVYGGKSCASKCMIFCLRFANELSCDTLLFGNFVQFKGTLVYRMPVSSTHTQDLLHEIHVTIILYHGERTYHCCVLTFLGGKTSVCRSVSLGHTVSNPNPPTSTQ